MLEEVGRWMQINGEAVYGSKAWATLGEGETKDGKLRKLPGGGLGRHHANFKFTPQDIRFTVGKNGKLYAFTMNIPDDNQVVRIKSMGKATGNLKKVKRVSLLGCKGKLKWKQTADALEVTYPAKAQLATSAVFKIE